MPARQLDRESAGRRTGTLAYTFQPQAMVTKASAVARSGIAGWACGGGAAALRGSHYTPEGVRQFTQSPSLEPRCAFRSMRPRATRDLGRAPTRAAPMSDGLSQKCGAP